MFERTLTVALGLGAPEKKSHGGMLFVWFYCMMMCTSRSERPKSKIVIMICLATGAISKDTKAFTIQNKIIISQGPGEKPNPKIVNLILSQLWEFRSFDTGV